MVAITGSLEEEEEEVQRKNRYNSAAAASLIPARMDCSWRSLSYL